MQGVTEWGKGVLLADFWLRWGLATASWGKTRSWVTCFCCSPVLKGVLGMF